MDGFSLGQQSGLAITVSLGEQIIEFGGLWAHAQHELVVLAAEFDASGEWAQAGARTAAHWIADQLDQCVSTAREWIRIGKTLVVLPVIHEVFASGELSYSKVRSLTRIATAENEAELVEIARNVPAGYLGRTLAAWSQRHEDPAARDARHQRERRLDWQVEPDGSVTGSFRLPPGDGGELTAAVDAMVMRSAASPKPAESANDASADALRWPSLAQQRADALVELVTGGGLGIQTEVVIHVRGDGATFDDGTPVTDTVVERLAPTAFLRALIHDAQGRPINASSRRRHPNTRQKRVVRERDRVCVDCGSTDLPEYDHVPEYEITGHTIIEELELRCSPCHAHRHGKQHRAA